MFNLRQAVPVIIGILLMVQTSAWAENEGHPGRVSGSSVNVRSGPSLSDRILGVAKLGDRVQIFGQKDGFLEIAYPDNCWMWMSKRYVKLTTEPGKDGYGTGIEGMVSGARVRIRVAPDLKSKIIREAAYQEKVVVTGSRGDWFKIQPDKGLRAWISARFVDRLAKPEPKPATVVVKPEVKSEPVAVKKDEGKPVQKVELPTDLDKPAGDAKVEAAPAKQNKLLVRNLNDLKRKGANADGVVGRVPPSTASRIGCDFRLLKGGITVAYLRSSGIDLSKFVDKKVVLHGTRGQSATGRRQPVLNVDFVETEIKPE